eukprot:SAG25_NODE_9112_length_387_cov_0.899306_1_plen_129_part_11
MQEAALAAQMVRPQSEGGPQIEEIVSGEEEQSELEPATPHPNSEASPVCDSETAHSTEQQPHTHPQSQPFHATSEAAERMTFMHQSVSEPGVALVSPQGLPADRYHYLMNWDWSGSLPKPQSGNEALPV